MKSDCRACKKRDLVRVLSLGQTALANAFLKKEELTNAENQYPLDVYLCRDCGGVQLGVVLDANILFKNYVYSSSTSQVFIKHFEDLADTLIAGYNLKPRDLIVDIGSNDGILLKPFQAEDMRVVGIEPAKTIAKLAIKNGIPTINAFISQAATKRIRTGHGRAKLVTATNVFAHIDDLDEVLRAVKLLLAKDGIFVVEVQYLLDLLKNFYFDMVYHEHLMYWSLFPMTILLKKFGLHCIDVIHIPTHGGSMRAVFALRTSPFKKHPRVNIWLADEKKHGLTNPKIYQNFAKAILSKRLELLTIVTRLKRQNKRIVGYGAPAKSTTLLNYFRIGPDYLDYIVDDSPLKQNLYTPGTHIPVVSSQYLNKDHPDYMLILAWNFAESIIKNNSQFKSRGGRYIIPLPTPYVL